MIDLLVAGHKNKQIAFKLKIPLSTIQRRTRKLLERGLVNEKVEPNYQKLGFKKGLFHVYLSDGNIQSIAEALAKVKGIYGQKKSSLYLLLEKRLGYQSCLPDDL